MADTNPPPTPAFPPINPQATHPEAPAASSPAANSPAANPPAAQQPVNQPTNTSTSTSSSSSNKSQTPLPGQSHLDPPVTSLSPTDLDLVRKALGVRNSPTDDGIPQFKSCWYYPPRNLPRGLYRDVVTSRTHSQFNFYFTATLYNTCLVLQLLLGASLTALGSQSQKNGTAITILAAANTVNAGLVALLHNSGLPSRIRNDWTEFDKVEMFLEELMDSGIMEVGMTRDDVVATCWKKYTTAKATVNSNKPSVYTGPVAGGPGVPLTSASVAANGNTNGNANLVVKA